MTTIIRFPYKPLAAAIAVIISPFSFNTFAQNAERATEEIIVVGTQKREQNLMEVPQAVDVLSATDLEETGSVLLGDVADYTPGFTFSKDDVVQGTASMRGISSSNISTGGDPSVAIFFDDVYMPRAAQSVQFSDIQRIEILKGPQGTLFGRNAAAGVVHIIPNAPAPEPDGFIRLRAGDYGLLRAEGMANAPLSDKVSLRVNLLSNQRDAYIDNRNPNYDGEELGNQNQLSARAALLWKISETTQLQFSTDWDDLDQGYRAIVGVSPYALNDDPSSREIANDVVDGHEWRDMSAYTFKLEHSFSEQWSGKFISSYRQWEASGRDDTDGTADITRYTDTINYEDSDIFYTEIQLNYATDKLHFVGGATYSSEDIFQRTTIHTTADTVSLLTTQDINNRLLTALNASGFSEEEIAGLGLPAEHIWNTNDWASIVSVLALIDPAANDLVLALGVPIFSPELTAAIEATGDLTYDVLAEGMDVPELLGPSLAGEFWGEDITNTGDFVSYGVYADFDFEINDRLGLAFGLRYSRDDKTFTWEIEELELAGRSLPNLTAQLYPQLELLEASESWDQVTGRALLRYQLGENHMLYSSYSTGYKSGGYDSLNPLTAALPFDPEEVENFEIGYKGTSASHLRLQTNVYRMDVTNRQRQILSQLPGSAALVPLIINGDQEILGMELIADWDISDSVSVGILTEYRDTDSIWEPFYDSTGEIVTESESDSSATTYTLTFDWTPVEAVGPGNLKVHFDYIYGENTAADDPGLLPVAYDIPDYFNDTKDLNMRISLTDDDNRWEVGLWSRNMLDNTTVGGIGGFAAEILGTPTTSVNHPRTVGMDFRYSFF